MTHEERFNKRIIISQKILARIAKIDEFKGLWHGSLRISPQILGRLKASVIITSSGASTRIEGSKLSDEEVARLLRGLNAKRPKGRDEQEVAGYADLLGRIFDNYKTLKISESQILQFHDILMAFSEKDGPHRGKFKTIDNTVAMENDKKEMVVLFHPTPPYLVKPEMETIIAWTNEQLEKQTIHPLLVMANFVFEFLAIHPFQDGNGRLSRALTNLILLKSGYTYVPYVSLEEIIEREKADYYLALRATQKNHKTDRENITPWVEYMLEILANQADSARRLMESDQPEKLLSEKQMQIYRLFAGEEEMGVAQISRLLEGRMPQATIKQALSRLVALRLLDRIGQARSTRYKKSQR